MKSLVFSLRALGCAALALAVAAPAAAQETPAEEPMRVEVAQDPMGVTRLAAGVLAALHNAGVHPSRGVFILRADSANANLNGSFAASDVPQSAFASARPAIAEFLRSRPDDRAFHVSFKLSEETLAVVGQRWEGRPVQPAAVKNRALFQAMLDKLAHAGSDPDAFWRRQAEIVCLVSPAGNVVAASMRRSTGDWHIDQAMIGIMYETAWEPARTADGQPVPQWFVYTLGLRRNG